MDETFMVSRPNRQDVKDAENKNILQWNESSSEDELAEADAIIVESGSLDERQIRMAGKCVVIVRVHDKSSPIALEVARQTGIMVSSVPNRATEEYTQFTVKIIQEMLGSEAESDDARHFRPLRLGLVGVGQVGQCVAQLACANGFDVWAHDPFAERSVFKSLGVRRASLNDLLGICDVISLHLPLTSETRNLIGLPEFGLMQREGGIVNTGAPDLIEFSPLENALASGRLKRAAITRLENVSPPPSQATEDALIQSGKLRWLDCGFDSQPAVKVRALAAGKAIARNCFKGIPPSHLLIDPPFPRIMRQGAFEVDPPLLPR